MIPFCLGASTNNYMGVTEMLLGSAICGIVFSIFSGQPLTIIGVTGPILVFEETLFLVSINKCYEYNGFPFFTSSVFSGNAILPTSV